MSDAQRRGLRSLFQIGFVQACIQLYQAFSATPQHLTADQVQAVTVFATPLLAFAQNWFEDNTNVPALLKGPANSGKNPQPDNAGSL